MLLFFQLTGFLITTLLPREKMQCGQISLHTGYRAFARRVLEKLPLENSDNDFVFDNELLVHAYDYGCRIGEITYAKNFPEGSPINVTRSAKYGLGCRKDSLLYVLKHMRAYHSPIYAGATKKALSTPVFSAL